jgi:SAM-dependent methyltransferase
VSASQTTARRFHPETAFGGFTDIDGSIGFYVRVQELLSPDATALDVGCGRGTQVDDPVRVRRELRVLRGKCKRVIGIDVDPAAAENPFVDEFRLVESGRAWPIENGSVELVLADFVLEHVDDPELFLSEAARVLRRGCTLCIRTVNAHSYLGLASRMVPPRLHRAVLDADVFPTLYRCNTVARLRRALAKNGFEAVVYGAEPEPAYLAFNRVAYGLGLAHRKLAPGRMRVGLIAWARRA